MRAVEPGRTNACQINTIIRFNKRHPDKSVWRILALKLIQIVGANSSFREKSISFKKNFRSLNGLWFRKIDFVSLCGNRKH